jgi:hypothetical protein
MKISKGDAVTYAALVASAVLQALDPFRKEAAMPPEAHPILSSHIWSYIPVALLTLVAIIWLIQRFRSPPAPLPLPNGAAEPSAKAAGAASQSLCIFGKYDWRIADLDMGENFGGQQRFYQLWLPIKFTRNARAVTVRVSVLRPTHHLDRRPPEYSWKAIESKDYFEGDVTEVHFASISQSRQNPGFYGDQREARYIGGISKHLFEIDVFFEGGRETTRIYLECPPPEVYGTPMEGLGKMAGTIVLQENENVFNSAWISETRAAVRGEKLTAKPEQTGGGFGFGALGSGPLGG